MKLNARCSNCGSDLQWDCVIGQCQWSRNKDGEVLRPGDFDMRKTGDLTHNVKGDNDEDYDEDKDGGNDDDDDDRDNVNDGSDDNGGMNHWNQKTGHGDKEGDNQQNQDIGDRKKEEDIADLRGIERKESIDNKFGKARRQGKRRDWRIPWYKQRPL